MTIELAIVLAGGRSSRMGGQDKLAMNLAGQPLLDHAIAAVATAKMTVTVGTKRPTARDVWWTREEPPGGGPVAGIAAGLELVSRVGPAEGLIAVVAGDMPFSGSAVRRLADEIASTDADVAIALDTDGRDQLLLAVWRWNSLHAAIERLGTLAGSSVRALLAGAKVLRVGVDEDAALDCDDLADFAHLTRITERAEGPTTDRDLDV